VVTTTMKRRPCVPCAPDDASHSDSGSGSDDDAPEVLSTKRPPGIEEYGSSSDAEPEQLREHPPSAPTPAIPPLGATGAAAIVAQPPTVVKVQPANHARRAPPPQPKNPPRNPFAARSSLLRSVSESYVTPPCSR
jgi:hypothetical protein